MLARVILVNVKDGNVTAKIAQVVKSLGLTLRPGDKVVLECNYSSCGPNEKAGAEGLIVAKIARDKSHGFTLHPYLIRRHGSRVEEPQ